MFLKVLILFLLHECNAQLHSFENDYIGNQLSVKEYKELEICGSKVCLEDAEKIISLASHKNGSDPCVNFEDFACGNFNNITFDKDERLKTILSEEINEDEPKVFKIIKKFYKKCVDSDYVKSEGKAEILNYLAEFGKFPAFESNWNSSDFNLTKALNAINDDEILKTRNTYEVVRDTLNTFLGLSHEMTSEVLNDFEEEFDDFSRALESYWYNQINDIYEAEFVLEMNTEECFELLKLESKKKIANCFMMILLMDKVNYFTVNSRPEKCMKQLHKFMEFPMYIMYQLKHKNDVDEGAFKDFLKKVYSLSSITDTTPIYYGLPDELTSTEFLNKIYANLHLTGNEGILKMFQEMKKYVVDIEVENLPENVMDIFKNCRFTDQQQNCYGAEVLYVFRIDFINFNSQRPYYVNLGYLYDQIERTLYINMQNNYVKYVEMFGAEQNLPGFLMTNQQMMEVIQYQKRCGSTPKYDQFMNIFNC